MHTGRIEAIIALAIAACLVLPARTGAQSEAPLPPLRWVEDVQDRFMISVPVTWQVKTSTGDPALEAKSPARPGELPDSLDVIVRDLPAPMSPEACIHRAEQLMRLMIRQFDTIEEKPDEISGIPAYAHSYAWRTSTGVDRRSTQVCLTSANRAFVMIGSTTNAPAEVGAHLSTLGRIMATFRPRAGAPEVIRREKPPWTEPGEPGMH